MRGTSRTIRTRWFQPVPELGTQKFNLILVDGPDLGLETVPFSRAGILEHIPEIIAESFIIIFDDAERMGESMTIKAIERIFRVNGRPFMRHDIFGVKTQTVFYSPDHAFLRSI